MLVHGPSNICTHASSMPIDTFAFVLTGGKSNGCVNDAGVGVGVTAGVATDVAVKIFGTFAKRKPTSARTAASINDNRVLKIIWLYRKWAVAITSGSRILQVVPVPTAEPARGGGCRRGARCNNARAPRHSEAATIFMRCLLGGLTRWVFI